VFGVKRSRLRFGRTLLLITVLAGLVAGDGSGISSLLGVLMPHGVAAATGPISPYTPPRGPRVDPTPFLHRTAPPPAPAGPLQSYSGPKGYVEGKSAEVPSLRTDRNRVYANPDGTYTTRTFAQPVNWQDSTGAWQPIDDTLAPRSDGRLHNASGPLDASFSQGGDAADVLSVHKGGVTAGFGLPAGASALTTPTRTGPSVLYGNVLPGTDLQYHVTSGGAVKEEVVLHAAPAGGADAVIRFPLHLNGLQPKADAAGGIGLYDTTGAEVLAIPPGTMFDSNVDPHSGSAPSAPISMSLDLSGATPAVVVRADGKWLSDPARVYPVSIDPTLIDVGKQTWIGDTFVSNYCGTCNYDRYPDSSLGFTDAIGYYSSSTGTNRTYLEYDLGSAYGTRILSGVWHGDFVWNYYTSASTPFWMHPVGASSAWNPGSLTWNNQDTYAPRRADVASGSAARNTWQTVDITGWVQNWVNGAWANTGIELDEGAHETDPTYGRRSLPRTTGRTRSRTSKSPTSC